MDQNVFRSLHLRSLWIALARTAIIPAMVSLAGTPGRGQAPESGITDESVKFVQVWRGAWTDLARYGNPQSPTLEGLRAVSGELARCSERV